VLVLRGATTGAEDRRLLNAFVAQLRLAQERTSLEQRAASAAELEEANSLRTALLAAVSHDLRTPLAAIKAAATSLLSKDVKWDRVEVHGFAETMDTEADRLTHLVTNLLDMSRLQTGALKAAPRPVPLEDVVYGAVGSLGAGGARVVVETGEQIPPAAADPGLLERALANVIENALAWSPNGELVRVEADRLADHVYIRVIDRGPGIPVDKREHVFEPFQRLGDNAGDKPDGVGLGLAVARGFVEAMHGSVAIEDTPGGGTTVVLSLARATV
jgi:two-component system sensor histidine kinase KdpD